MIIREHNIAKIRNIDLFKPPSNLEMKDDSMKIISYIKLRWLLKQNNKKIVLFMLLLFYLKFS